MLINTIFELIILFENGCVRTRVCVYVCGRTCVCVKEGAGIVWFCVGMHVCVCLHAHMHAFFFIAYDLDALK
jgi:hypothetical protein